MFEIEVMKKCLIHDNHKIYGRGHSSKDWKEEKLPLNVDVHASRLSRPARDPTGRMVEYAHASDKTHYRISLLGQRFYKGFTPDHPGYNITTLAHEHEKLKSMDAEEIHLYYLGSAAIDGINESMFFPHTSLKYHELLCGALYYNYSNGWGMGDLYLCAGTEKGDYRTVLFQSEISLGLLPKDEAGAYPRARMWKNQAMNFGNVWCRMNDMVFEDSNIVLKAIEMNLRRMFSWSTGLHYIEDTLRGMKEGEDMGKVKI